MTTEPSNLPPFMTVNYVSDYLQVAPRTVRRLIKSKDIIVHRIRGQLRVSDKDLTTYTRTSRDV
jgi:excisionase family DNA binding protein